MIQLTGKGPSVHGCHREDYKISGHEFTGTAQVFVSDGERLDTAVDVNLKFCLTHKDLAQFMADLQTVIEKHQI